MSGETNLARLLAAMTPALQPGRFVFATLPHGAATPASITPVMSFREAEGLTVILSEEAATQASLEGIFPSRMITLEVHSSLEAVGFLAAITRHLAAAGIGVNPVSAFYHDHLFVPAERAEEAMRLLTELSAAAREGRA
ncbi:ACT domain-containing protein [Labrys okinawensis]|uniref:ACT domain-containing protein n=1 Tax=Labrys okinawensis TaxID=346911 RepID=UPI0039BC7484